MSSPEETLRCIFSYTTSPEALSKTSKALYYTSKDPYLRAQVGASHSTLETRWRVEHFSLIDARSSL